MEVLTSTNNLQESPDEHPQECLNDAQRSSPSGSRNCEIRDASLQFVRKLSGIQVPSRANEAAFERAVQEVAASARVLIPSLVTTAEPRKREAEAAKKRARLALRFGNHERVSHD